MAKVLYWDIENSYMLGAVWQTYNISHIPPSNIIQDTFIISAQWKWEGGQVESISSNGKDDTRVIKKLHGLLSSADYAVAHNGDRHDWPVTLGRMQVLGLPPINEPTFLDTLKMAKKARFASRSLDALCQKFDLPRKREAEKGIWLAATLGDKEAIKKIEEYGRGDIEPLEALYKRLSPYGHNKINRGLFTEYPCCPNCQSQNMQARGLRVTKVSKMQRWQCQDCGAWASTSPRIKGAFFK